MNKLIIAAVIATLSGTAFAQGGQYDFTPPKDRLDVPAGATGSQPKIGSSINVSLFDYTPPKDRLDVPVGGSTGNQSQIGSATGSSVWDYTPPKDRLNIQ